MARQTWAALAALYPDNTAGAISPADLRAGLIDSMRPHVTSSAPDASDDETLGFDVGHAWIDTSTSPPSVYECVDSTTGNAVWVKRYPQDAGGGGGGGNAYYDLNLGFYGAPDAGAADMVLVPRAVTISDSDPGEVHVGTNPTDGTAAIDVQVNGVSVGGLEIATTGVVTWDLAAPIELEAGDLIALVAPTPADADMADVIVAFRGTAA